MQAEFDALDEALGVLDDLLPQFAPDNQKFVDDFNHARTIVDTAAATPAHASPDTRARRDTGQINPNRKSFLSTEDHFKQVAAR